MLDNTNPGFLPNGFQAPNPGAQNMIPASPVRTIGDALNEKNITWAYFGGSYNDAVALSNDAVMEQQASVALSAGKRSEFEDVTVGELFALIVVIGFVAWAALSLMSEPLRI